MLIYKLTHIEAQVASFFRLWNSFNSTRRLNEKERHKTINTNSFVNINNNTAPFVSITWHLKEPLGCVVFSHCPTNNSYNKCINACSLPCSCFLAAFWHIAEGNWETKDSYVTIYVNKAKVYIFPLRKIFDYIFTRVIERVII